MPLTAGTQLGPYKIQAPLGAGGMGEVYRARDPRLERIVAIKILPTHLTEDANARERLEREARAIASLNHPNICHLYDIGSQDGMLYLVMEFLEGETLTERLRKGALPMDRILRYGAEIAEGLDKAHRTGVVHRDLKPGNVMLTKSGAKLMDFGLAKALAPSDKSSSGLTQTMTNPSHPLTAEGTIVGTFQYMSPEQVEGHDADARSDIFSLGAVLYEMVTGKRAFEGKTTASTVAAILASEPKPATEIQPLTPPALGHTIRTCLAKDPDERYQTAHDVKLQLKWIAEGGSQAGVPAPVVALRKKHEHWWIAAAISMGALALAALAGMFWTAQKAARLDRPLHAQVVAPEHYTFTSGNLANHNVLSPDGTMIAFIAEADGKQMLWVRPLSSDSPQALAGSEGASYPFWSPDSRFLGFFSQGKLRKVQASGGVIENIADAPYGRGGTWNRDGVILFTPGIHDEVYRVSESAGPVSPVTKSKIAGAFAGSRWPQFLPDGHHFLYLHTEGHETKGKVFAGSVDSPDSTQLIDEVTNVQYADGYLFYAKDNNLVAQPFDPGRLRLSGNPLPVASGIEYFEAKGLANFSVSQSGLLAYRTAHPIPSRFQWLDRTGKLLSAVGEPDVFGSGRVSPDGRSVVVARRNAAGKMDLWLMDAERSTLSRSTFEPMSNYTAAWSPDGTQLVFAASPASKVKLGAANGSGAVRELSHEIASIAVTDWSPDGTTIVMQQQNSMTGWDIFAISANGDGTTKPILQTPFDETNPRFSPDGHWLAFVSNETGRPEVYVIPYPGPGGRWQISKGAATGVLSLVAWSRDGKQIYYRGTETSLMAVDLNFKDGVPNPGEPKQIFSDSAGIDWLDTAPDGRILIRTRSNQGATPPIQLIVNWEEALRRQSGQN